MACSGETVDKTLGGAVMWFPSSEVATLGWMVSLCKSVSHTCCGSAEQSAEKAETPWLFPPWASGNAWLSLYPTYKWNLPFITFASGTHRRGTVSKAQVRGAGRRGKQA